MLVPGISMKNTRETNDAAGDFDSRIRDFQRDWNNTLEQVAGVIVGHKKVSSQVLACLLAGGHGLIEGVPGIGKTLIVRTLADALNLEFKRIQFTPDLMPADITGTDIVDVSDNGTRSFHFHKGPIFSNLVLADEINRATPKTQSAVLEAMQEGTVTMSGQTYRLPAPLLVLATQNPIEMEGTYPLPEAQLDRFMLKIVVDSPHVDDLVEIFNRTTGKQAPCPEQTADAERIQEMKDLVRQVPVPSHVTDYVARLVDATHPERDSSPEFVNKFVRFGASPRGGQAAILIAKVCALADGRPNVSFEDVQNAMLPCMQHRIIMNFEGQTEGYTGRRVIEEVLASIPRTRD